MKCIMCGNDVKLQLTSTGKEVIAKDFNPKDLSEVEKRTVNISCNCDNCSISNEDAKLLYSIFSNANLVIRNIKL